MIEQTGSLRIGLDSWIIQDGNYGEFTCGDICAFALEYSEVVPLEPRHRDAPSERSLSWLHDCTYSVKADVIYASEGLRVIDAGLGLYRERPILPGVSYASDVSVGQRVRGDIYIGIDHFAYFERLSKLPGAPPLIHDWRVQKIELETTPWISPSGYPMRDPSRRSWQEVRTTHSSKDDDGRASYILTCQCLSEPRRTIRR